MSQITAIDLSILDWIQTNLRSGVLDGFFSVITHLADSGVIWIVLAALLLAFRKTRPLGLCVALALIVDLFLCNILVKPVVARIRPYDLNNAIQLLISAPHDYSFPSGHTAVSFAAVTSLWRSRSKLWRWALILSVIIAFSRLYLYVHYPTDILGGVVFGVAAGLVGAAVAKKLNRVLRRFSFWG